MTDEDMITAIIELSAAGRQTTADGIAQRFNVPPAMITEDLLRLDAAGVIARSDTRRADRQRAPDTVSYSVNSGMAVRLLGSEEYETLEDFVRRLAARQDLRLDGGRVGGYLLIGKDEPDVIESGGRSLEMVARQLPRTVT